MKKIAEIILFWLIPFGGLALFSWLNRTYQWLAGDTFVFRLLFPALMMYLVVITGAGRFKLWAFKVNYAIGGVLPQIGLIYAAVANLLALAFYPFEHNAPLLFVGLMGLGGALAGVVFDYFAVQNRLLEVRVQRSNPGWDARSVVLSYGPRFFGMTGLLVGLGFLAGSCWMSLSAINPMVAAVVIAFLGFLPFGFYLYLLITSIRKKERYDLI
jgi:hypothetical protein